VLGIVVGKWNWQMALEKCIGKWHWKMALKNGIGKLFKS
jgi:hypothetical protein